MCHAFRNECYIQRVNVGDSLPFPKRWSFPVARRLPTSPRHLSVRPTLTALEDRAVPAAFTVTNLDSAGIGSLRNEIRAVNRLAAN
jgi:hypothetical protein